MLPVLCLARCYWALSQISLSVGAGVEPASQNIAKVDFLNAVTAVLPSMYLDFTANWNVISSPLVTFPISLTSLWFLSRSYGKYLWEEKQYYVTEVLKISVSCYNAPTALLVRQPTLLQLPARLLWHLLQEHWPWMLTGSLLRLYWRSRCSPVHEERTQSNLLLGEAPLWL